MFFVSMHYAVFLTLNIPEQSGSVSMIRDDNVLIFVQEMNT